MTSTPPQSLWTGPADDPDRYRVDLVDGALTEIGGGGEGLVYEALRTDGGDRRVALKLFTNVPIDAYAEMEHAARLLAGVAHPNLMRQVDAFRGRALGPESDVADDDFSIICVAAEWIDGEPLQGAVERQGPAAGLRWVADVAHALTALHATRVPGAPDGIVHGDVKPSNVRVDRDGDAILIDFGSSRPIGGESASPGVGTYRWRAPELVAGDADPSPASDAWGLGALGCWVLVGEPPPIDPTVSAHQQLVDAAHQRGFVNSTQLAAHLGAALDRNPARRPRDLDRWADALERLVRARHRVPWARRPALVGLLGALIGVFAGVGLTLAVQELDWPANRTPVATGLPGSVLRLARPFAVPDSRPDEQVLRQDHVVTYRGGRVLLSGGRDGDQPLLANDELELEVTHADGAIARYVHNYGASTNCQTDEATPPQDVTGLFAHGRNIVRVIIRGGCNGGDVGLGGYAGAGTPIWLTFGTE